MNIRQLKTIMKQSPIYLDECMSCRTTFHTGGCASFFLMPQTANQLTAVAQTLQQCGEDFILLGNGSNVLFCDQGYKGTVLSTLGLKAIALCNQNLLRCDAGVSLPALCQFAAKNALSGLEFACGIPATVGGAIKMNAGCYGSSIADVITCMTIYRNGAVKILSKDELAFGYRSCNLLKNDIVLQVEIKLTVSDRNLILHRMREYAAARRLRQPIEQFSAGSVFLNPSGGYAAAFIEQAGLKGYEIGGAKVSEKHSNFIVNFNQAKSEDILNLIDYIQKKVYNLYKIKLQTELIIIS